MRKIDKSVPPTQATWGSGHPAPWPGLVPELKRQLAACTTIDERRKVARAFYEALDNTSFRKQLWTEQRGLCAFCEAKVNDKSVQEDPYAGIRIAHWKPIKVRPEGAIDWSNLFASCPGGAGGTCDEAQGETDLRIDSPASRDHTGWMRFGSDGTLEVKPGQPELQAAVWQLNLAPKTPDSKHALTEARAAAIDAVRIEIEEHFSARTASREALSKIREAIADGRNRTPHPSAVLAWLDRQIARR